MEISPFICYFPNKNTCHKFKKFRQLKMEDNFATILVVRLFSCSCSGSNKIEFILYIFKGKDICWRSLGKVMTIYHMRNNYTAFDHLHISYRTTFHIAIWSNVDKCFYFIQYDFPYN